MARTLARSLPGTSTAEKKSRSIIEKPRLSRVMKARSEPVPDYSIKIRHLCDKCKPKIEKSKEKGLLVPLKNAKFCPVCGYKAMHQPYYKICSTCVRILKQCAVCRGPYKVPSSNSCDALLSPDMRWVSSILPELCQRELYRYTYKYWEKYLKGKNRMTLDAFQNGYIEKCCQMIDEVKNFSNLTQGESKQAVVNIPEKDALLNKAESLLKKMKDERKIGTEAIPLVDMGNDNSRLMDIDNKLAAVVKNMNIDDEKKDEDEADLLANALENISIVNTDDMDLEDDTARLEPQFDKLCTTSNKDMQEL